MPLLTKNGHLMVKNGHLVQGPRTDECCCDEGPTEGNDCPTFCEAGRTAQAWNITFGGIAPDNCGTNAYYNDTFQFSQHSGTPCTFDFDDPTPDVWGGPCSIGPTHMVFHSGYVEIDISEVGGAVFLRAPHTNGDPCDQELTFTYHHQVGAPHLALDWTGCTAIALPN